jgi:type I restriction enzyme S subunit
MMNEQGIPKGYKKTEVGVIPEEWNVNSLSEIGIFFKGKGIKRNDVAENGTTPCVRYGEIYTRYECYVTNPVSYVSDEVAFTAQPIDYGDLLFAGSGETADEIGKCVAYLGPTPAVAGGDVVVLRPRMVAPLFLGYLLNHAIVSKQKSKFGQGDAVVHISSNNLGKIIIPLPPLPEQRAIAAALSDVDGLLSALDALIAKKRALKTAAMQSLLTGRIRLPGFTGEWVTRRLGDVAELLKGHGLSKSTLEPDGQWFCILYGELFTTYKEVITNVKSRTNIRYQGLFSLAGDVLLPGSTTTTGVDLAKASALLLSNILLGSDIIVVRQKENANAYDASFLAYSLTYVYKHKIAQKTKGITIYHLHGKDLVDLEVTLPSIDEQRAIAAVLADMDAEIAALESRREKVRQVKQGMMQVLLTGKVRLVNKDNAV